LEVVARYPNEPLPRAAADLGGIRTLLVVPLRKDSELLGVITAYRQEMRPFSDKQIELLQSFAAQAVIAMENARLLTEQREALEQQTATAEVLRVINSSPGNLAPVFDAILDKAHNLCSADHGSLYIAEADAFRAVALRGVSDAFADLVRQLFRPGPNHPVRQLIAGNPFVVVNDASEIDDPIIQNSLKLAGMHSALFVPLRKDKLLLGYIVASSPETRVFTDKQIAVLQNFAAQAVIAMESARLLNEIRQRQDELRVTFENMGDGVAMFDGTQRLVAWNRNFQEILDLPDALLERHCTYEEHLHFLAARGDFGPGVDTVEQINELVASTGHPYGYERTRPDGRVIEIRRNPVPDGGLVLLYSDITERKRSEEEIRAARDAAETSLRELKAAQANLIQAEKMASLGQLTAGIAHEIKNPLNFVNNFAELSGDLLDELHDAVATNQQGEIDELTVTLKGNLAKIAEHGKRADGIVRSMLEHSRGSSGERRSVDLNTLVDEALNLAYHGARAQDQSFNITLERDFDEGVTPITLVPQDVTRVLLNLFSNGFYAARRRQSMETTPGFEPTLKVATRELGDAVEIKVRDNGIGIPTEIWGKLFQPFFTTKPTGEGTGLGLSISYDIVTQQHGGSITVDSKVGDHSEFTIRLPRKP
jgi:signal transduction histidine kinase/GAF domain-containing protein